MFDGPRQNSRLVIAVPEVEIDDPEFNSLDFNCKREQNPVLGGTAMKHILVILAFSLTVAAQQKPRERIDVPAIASAWLDQGKDNGACTSVWLWIESKVEKGHCLKRVQDCKDKTRILMHDEQEPPKYWCHKVQPEPKP